MDKIKEIVKKELGEIEKKGITTANIELVGKLVDIYKDVTTTEAMEKSEGGREMYDYDRYRDDMSYRRYQGDGYREYGRRGSGGGRGRYVNTRMRDHMERMMDGMDQYEYGKERYMHGGDDRRVVDGLEKLMYALCMFVESAMDYAETPEEKEIIRKHAKKIAGI